MKASCNINEGVYITELQLKVPERGGVKKTEVFRSQPTPFIDVIHYPPEIEKRYHALVKSAKEQILLFLPTTTAYRREEKMGIFDSLEGAATQGVDIRILV